MSSLAPPAAAGAGVAVGAGVARVIISVAWSGVALTPAGITISVFSPSPGDAARVAAVAMTVFASGDTAGPAGGTGWPHEVQKRVPVVSSALHEGHWVMAIPSRRSWA